MKYSIPVVNLTNNYLTVKERVQLILVYRYIKKNLAANLGVVAEIFTDYLKKNIWEDFQEFLRAHRYSNREVCWTKNDTYHNLKRILNRWIFMRSHHEKKLIILRKCKGWLTIVLLVVFTHLQQIIHSKISKLSVTLYTVPLKIMQNMTKMLPTSNERSQLKCTTLCPKT